MSWLSTLTECLLTGVVTGLTLWGLAKIGVVPVIGIVLVNKEEDVE